MGKITNLLAMAAAAVGGIYLTSDEGAKARKALLEKKNALKPVIEDLKKQTIDILEGTKKIDSDEIRVNVEVLLKEARKILLDFDVDKTIEATKNAIQVAQKKIREANAQTMKAIENKKKKIKSSSRKLSTSKTTTLKAIPKSKTETLKAPSKKKAQSITGTLRTKIKTKIDAKKTSITKTFPFSTIKKQQKNTTRIKVKKKENK